VAHGRNRSTVPQRVPKLDDFKQAVGETPRGQSSAAVREAAEPATAFQLSRLYAKGWLAGSNHDVAGTLAETCSRGAQLNPCRLEVERERWLKGFTDAVARRLRNAGQAKPHFKTSPAL
jgi:hypothetical protein